MPSQGLYNIDTLPQLVTGVDEQIKTGKHNLEANLALLRFYQFQPSSIDVQVLAKVLLLSMMQLPSSDFKICLHLVPEQLHQNDETISKVVALANALETTRFSEFWAMVGGSSKDVASLVPGFAEAVRKYVLHVMGISFQRTSKSVLADALNLDNRAIDNLIKEQVKSHGWNVQKNLITLPKNEMNIPVVIKRTQGSQQAHSHQLDSRWKGPSTFQARQPAATSPTARCKGAAAAAAGRHSSTPHTKVDPAPSALSK